MVGKPLGWAMDLGWSRKKKKKNNKEGWQMRIEVEEIITDRRGG